MSIPVNFGTTVDSWTDPEFLSFFADKSSGDEMQSAKDAATKAQTVANAIGAAKKLTCEATGWLMWAVYVAWLEANDANTKWGMYVQMHIASSVQTLVFVKVLALTWRVWFAATC